MRILAVIPARGGSKGVPRKNLRSLGGRPLLSYAVEVARVAGIFTDIVVTTDDPEIQAVALREGAQAPFLRPAELATDSAGGIPTIVHAVEEMERRTGAHYDYVILLQPTAPLRTAEDVKEATRRMIDSGADAVISVVDVDNWHPMKMKRLQGDWLVDYEPPPYEGIPRQALPRVYIVNGAVYGVRRDVLMESGSLKGERCLGYVMPPERSVNIDTEVDLVVAEHYLAARR